MYDAYMKNNTIQASSSAVLICKLQIQLTCKYQNASTDNHNEQ